ncbi:lantibiotic dehydratase [Streptomyces sp. NPDC006879]|uniref:lantibiotic dehydratase n=1 Tax=Streptomyces sp. NPDC006879 TaxID=3364767 RepID=UPI0036773A8E
MSTQDGTPPGDGWHIGRRFMLRVAGLPMDTVASLRCEDACRWADEVLIVEEALRDSARTLSDLLHEAVGATDPDPGSPGAAQRRELLRLRRQIHNNRLPSDPETAVQAVAQVTAAAADQVAGWLRHRDDLAKLGAEGAPLLAAELDRNRQALRAVLADERLRHGLLLASPALDAQLDSYLRTSGAPTGRARKVERAVLSYLYRTACKTSPFSTFTAVATGQFTTGAPTEVPVEREWSSHVRLNVVVLARFAELILADPGRRRDLPLRLASGWGHADERIRYVRRWVTAGDDTAAVTFDAVKDKLFYLRRSGTLDRLLALFDDRPELRHHELATWLAEAHQADTADCEAYIAALLQLGMVRVPCLDTTVHSGDPLRAFRRSLLELRRPWADRLCLLLGPAADALARYPMAERSERRMLLSELRRGLGRAQQELLVPEEVFEGTAPEGTVAAAGGQRPGEVAEAALLPQTLVYEDTSAGRDLPCPPLPAAGAALRAVESVLPAFDLTLAQRITFEGFFTARYGSGGRCTDLLGLVHDFHEDFFDQYLSFTARRSPFDEQGEYVPEVNWLGLPGLRALDTARRAFVDRMRAAFTEHHSALVDPSAELRLEEADLSAVARELALVPAGFTPRCHHLQLATDPATGLSRTVLNRSYGGLSFPFSRFSHVYDDQPVPLAEELRATAAAVTPEGAVLAEVTGGPVTSNLNLHGRLMDHQIICPGESATVPPDQQIALSDLYAEHDAASGRVMLRSHRLGREVIPVYLGYLVPLALAAIPRTLLLLSATSMSPIDVWAGVPEGPARDGVTHRPRVVHGDVVLARRSWSTTAAVLTSFLPAEPGGPEQDARRLLAWRRWRRQHDLPEQVFATVFAGASAVGAKPQFVDFRSRLSLATFETMLRDPGHRVTLRELLPDAGGLYVRSDRGAHVAELAVETFTHHTPAGTTPPETKGGATCPS